VIAGAVASFSSKLTCRGSEPQTVAVYDNEACSSTPKQTIAVGVNTCVSVSQYNISLRADCSNGAGLTLASNMLVAAMVGISMLWFA